MVESLVALQGKLVVEIDVILACMGQTVLSYQQKYINRKVDGKKK